MDTTLEAVADAPAPLDPRVRRTRQMLYEALDRLLALRSIDRISVGDIAEEATLNRATVYDHYADKYTLLQGLVAARFDELLTRRAVTFDGTCPSAIKNITLALCDYLSAQPRIGCEKHMAGMESHFERALGQVIRSLILGGMRQHPPSGSQSPELVSAAVAGALYAAAREWVRFPAGVSAEDAVDSIYKLVGPMLGAH